MELRINEGRLIITRTEGQAIVIGHGQGLDIRIEVLKTRKSRVKLAVRCPRHFTVLRAELLDRSDKSNSKKEEQND